MSLVSLVKIEQLHHLKQAILDSLSLIGYNFQSNLENIVIKPNICYYWDYSTGQTTDPKFVAALIDIIREKIAPNTNISIVESDASAMKCKYAFRMLGFEKLAQKYNVKLVNLSDDKSDTVKVTAGDRSFQLMIPQTIQRADLKINVPKIKYTMEPIKLTCALKNIFGCNPYPKKFKYHSNLGEAIVAINKAMKFDLCIIDGNIVSGIQPRRLGLVMASKDPVAIDTAAAEIAGLNPKTIEYLQLAEKEGLGTTSFIPKGTSISYFKAGYPKKNLEKKLMNLAYKTVTHIGLGKRLGLE
ncbi:MAG: DUF362 domain-containing protein [Candidatus Helarchaeota archaeon]